MAQLLQPPHQMPAPSIRPALTPPQKLVQLLTVLASLGLGTLLALLVGARPDSIGTDTLIYRQMYDHVAQCQCWLADIEPGFNHLMAKLSALQWTAIDYLTAISALQLLLMIYLAKRTTSLLHYPAGQNFKWLLIFMLLMLLSPFFISAQTNVLRQAVGGLFLFLAALSLLQARYIPLIIWAFLAANFHATTMLYMVFMAGLLLSFNIVAGISLALFVLYITGASQLLIELLSHLSGLPIYQTINDYSNNDSYNRGIRFDFAVFSIFPLALYFIAQWLDVHHKDQWLARLRFTLKLYLLLLIPFWLFGWANYADRFAFYAWFAMPLVLTIFIFPLLNRLSNGLLFISMVLALVWFVQKII